MDHSGLQPTYDYDALETLRRCRVTHLRAWCTAPGCTHWMPLHVETLIGQVGPSAGLVQLARRMRCKVCGRRGVHVQIASPPVVGQPLFRPWLAEEVERAKALIAWAYSPDNRYRLDRPKDPSREGN